MVAINMSLSQKKASAADRSLMTDEYNKASSEERQKAIDDNRENCRKFSETDAYSDSDSYGYIACCDLMGLCGMSGWMIFLIILIVLLCLAGAAAAFWFFYLKRKMGGRDEEKEIESTADTATTGHDISVDTY